jgi:hypothetical protein
MIRILTPQINIRLRRYHSQLRGMSRGTSELNSLPASGGTIQSLKKYIVRLIFADLKSLLLKIGLT